MEKIKGIILAAGRGSRMVAATAELPKGFVSLAGRKMIEWQLGALKEAGVSEIVGVGGYRSDKLSELLPVPCVNERWSETNSVASLRCASELFRAQRCIVSYSDIVYHPGHVTKLMGCSSPIAISYDRDWLELWKLRSDNPLSDAETFAEKDGLLQAIGDKPDSLNDINGQFMGLISISPEGWTKIENYLSGLSSDEVDRLDVTSLLQRLLKQGVEIGAVPVSGRWCEVDTMGDKNAYEEALASKEGWAHDWRWI